MLNNRIMKEKPSGEEMNTRLKDLQKKPGNPGFLASE